jgi:hypothetical protein
MRRGENDVPSRAHPPRDQDPSGFADTPDWHVMSIVQQSAEKPEERWAKYNFRIRNEKPANLPCAEGRRT